jgi:hypothetical protein
MKETSYNYEDEVQLQEAKNYVQRATVPAIEGRKCVDGRYQHDQQSGMLARPGGDFGYVMALLAVNNTLKLGLTPRECFEKVYRAVTSDQKGKFGMHTDQHANSEDGHKVKAIGVEPTIIGCGHIAKACNEEFSEAYGLEPYELRELVDAARERLHEGGAIDMVTLAGDHAEKGVLIIDSQDSSVDPYDSEQKSMYFIYDRMRDEIFMKKLVETLALQGLTYESLKDAADKQLQTTLRILAPGAPMFVVDFTKQDNVSLAGKIEPLKK